LCAKDISQPRGQSESARRQPVSRAREVLLEVARRHSTQAAIHSLKPLNAVYMNAGKLSQFKLG
jgi:hypothetical protein